jgi:S1-C subfamily serine protease
MAAQRVSGRVAALVLIATALVAALIGFGLHARMQDGTTATPQAQAVAVSPTVAPPTPTPHAPLVLSTGTPTPDTDPSAITSVAPINVATPVASVAPPAAFDPERLYAAVGPAVVTISNKQKPRPNAALREANFGSGIIFDARGYIITNRHVIDGAEAIDITLQDGTVVPGTLVGVDTVVDIAVVKIDAAAVPIVATLGDSALVRTGQHVVAIGSPNQFENSVTRGIISGTDRTVGGMDGMIQTDTPLSRGNSGGALVSAGGEVIGLITGYITANQVERVAFAIPSNSARQLAGMIVTNGMVPRPYIGVTTELLTPARAEELHVAATRGAYINEVSPNTPGARAGLRTGDVITAINGAPVDGAHPLPAVLLNAKSGDTVTLTINRGGAEQPIAVDLIERPAGASTHS